MKTWIIAALKSKTRAFVELGKKFFRKRHYILNYFICKITTSISEEINNKIKRLKRMAYGYRDVKILLTENPPALWVVKPSAFNLNTKYLRKADDAEAIDVLHREVLVNKPSGAEPFIKRLEKRFSCTLRRQKAGRPPKLADITREASKTVRQKSLKVEIVQEAVKWARTKVKQ